MRDYACACVRTCVCVLVCVCQFGFPVSGVVAVSTAISDGMKNCEQGERFLA